MHFITVKEKKAQRSFACKKLDAEFHKPLNHNDSRILNLPISKLNALASEGELKVSDIVLAYGKQALRAQEKCNPLTEIMIDEAKRDWVPNSPKGSLYGVPVSLKDMHPVKGYDTSLGFSNRCFKPSTFDSPLVQVIKAAGGIPYVKTNIPLTLLSFECSNDVFGVTQNPHVTGYSPGGSSGGEASLIAFGGSRVGVGSDVAGSVRLPAHFCGIYSLRPTTLRFPRAKTGSAMYGQEGVPSVNGPMARTLGDLKYFFKAIIDAKPWEYDYQAAAIPWKEDKLPDRPLKFGVIYTDDIVDPSPACARALNLTTDALKKQGHEIVEFRIPNSLEALAVGSQLLCSDGLEVSTSHMAWGESHDAGVKTGWLWTHVPYHLRLMWSYIVQYVYGDRVWATLLRGFGRKTVKEQWDLVNRREQYRAVFFDKFKESGADFLISVPNATPAFPHQGLRNSWGSCLYTFLFNILDYPAGVLPVTKVDSKVDALPKDIKYQNAVAKGAYLNYDAQKMEGLPVGIQVIGKKYEDELVLQAMQVVEDSLHKAGTVYKQLDL